MPLLREVGGALFDDAPARFADNVAYKGSS
jgi:hypothetical protein